MPSNAVMAGVGENKELSKFRVFLRKKITWKRIEHYCCQSRKDARLFWSCYLFIMLTLFLIFMIAFLRTPSITVNYLKWYNESCSIDSLIDCDRSLRLYCSTATQRCACLNNMFWNSSFCDCLAGMFYNGLYCQQRLTFGQPCNPQANTCIEYLTCSSTSNTCDCPSNSYYNQTTCNPQLTYNATTPCVLSSECISGLICSSNLCSCPTSQSWNGNTCSTSATNGAYCLSSLQCDSSALLFCNSTFSRCTCSSNSYWDGQLCRVRRTNGSLCNNTQQCSSSLSCINSYCQCPLINSEYWASQTSTCEFCYGKDLFLFDGLCYHIPPPTNSTLGTYAILSTSYTLSTIQYDYQFNYLFNQHARVFNWTPIYFSSRNPLTNYFQWSTGNTIIKPKYFCNGTITSNYMNYVLSFKMETLTPCLRAWSSSTTGQLVNQLNSYFYHTR